MGDLIDRQAAIDALDGIFDNVPMELTTEILRLRRELRGLPSADVAPVVHGKWVWKPTKQYCPSDCWYPPLSYEETWDEKNGTWLEDEMYCSECDYHNYHEIKYNFCPNCGAKMDDEGKKDMRTREDVRICKRLNAYDLDEGIGELLEAIDEELDLKEDEDDDFEEEE